MMSPSWTLSPTLATGVKCHTRSRSNEATSIPRAINELFDCVAISFSGRWIPSNIEDIIPGPSSTDKGCPVGNTGSPGPTIDVSS